MKKIIFTALTTFMFANMANAQKIIAHRGYWDTENNAKNSIQSLKSAQEINVYGSEFDVLISADDVLMVNHDDHYQGYTIETTNSTVLKTLKLANNKNMPTLEEYIEQGKKNKNVKLIFELKPHSSKENENRAVKKAVELIKKYQIEDQIEIISFSQNICDEFKRLAPEHHVSYLNGDLSPKEIKEKGWNGIDYNYKVFQKNPNWVKEAQALGLLVNVWTVNQPKVMQEMIDLKVDYITTDKPLILKELLTK
ncbi:glycerophosphodiester phosphodiesterase family protein [Empedobacter stercoris]|uniref:glycerophosphodiester phosphodiesterase family protein n=1 Tax=Empedobacter stercoris TaxID=1628248 RepID=UPI001CE1B03A|nr:glycerophosphodiester phosphodiesterase family protein [Empedobacter stercoris]MCA4776252.1 glycerophosphodiester phosphodiesterase [Empedobacter stercoris]